MTHQKPKGFELHKCYEHCGGSKIHTIALAEESEMWFVDKDKGMLIAEGRDGSLTQVGTSPGSAVNWYEIDKQIFRDDLSFKELKFEDQTDPPKSAYYLRVYENGKVYFFSFIDYYDDCGLLKNLAEDNSADVLLILKDLVSPEILNQIERMLFQRL